KARATGAARSSREMSKAPAAILPSCPAPKAPASALVPVVPARVHARTARRRLTAAPQYVQHFLAGMAVLDKAHARLEFLDGVARAGPDLAVDLAVIVAERAEPLLQLLRLLESQPLERPVPVADQAAVSADLVGEEPHGQSIFVGVVVALDDEEVLGHQEGRAGTPVRHLQFGVLGRPRKALAVRAHHSDRGPAGQRHRS